jgi:hypothetical protein
LRSERSKDRIESMRTLLIIGASLLGLATGPLLAVGLLHGESASAPALAINPPFRDPLFICSRPLGCEAFDTQATPPQWLHFRKGDIVWPERYFVLHGTGWKKIR